MDPFQRFHELYERACSAIKNEANVVFLATVDEERRPHCRAVLFKEVQDGGDRGFVFYTNLESGKAAEIALNSQVALTFYWSAIGIQVRIEGVARPVVREKVEQYWNSRPLESRVSGTISKQSQPLVSYEALQNKFKVAQSELGVNPPCPEYWGGFCVVPKYFEFWEQDSARLHKRATFNLTDSEWKKGFLQP